jgi:hypothetical protein
VKFAACLILAAAPLLVWAEREGNFTIRFEPKAILQTGAVVPFEISVTDSRHNPVQAEVKLYIETADGRERKLFAAPAVTTGVYLAKPIFPEAGDWKVDVEVRRNDQFSARSLQFNVRE